jgi:hypothetical protein
MPGHFEDGKWIEAFPPSMGGSMDYKIHVDLSELEFLEAKLKEMNELYNVVRSMTTFWQRLRWLITGKVR